MINPVLYNSVDDTVDMIDQTLLPRRKEIVRCRDENQVAKAIKTMQVRGAPAIGVAAAFGVYLGLRNFKGTHATFINQLEKVCKLLASTRPTAVNLFWAINRVKQAVLTAIADNPNDPVVIAAKTALGEAQAILDEDIAMCRAIGKYGAELLLEGQTWLTHCNAGALATGGYGTALGVFRAAKEQGKRFTVFVDETRPLLQGARLTAWEMVQEEIDAVLICDNMAGSLMAAGKIHSIVVGADRITAEGFVANKIGTYPLAVLAKFHKIPFYVAAPVSTFDLFLGKGSEIKIEERSHDEVTGFGGNIVAPDGIRVANPAFDVTPPELVTAVFTNFGTLRPPFSRTIRQIIGATSESGDKQLEF